MQRLLYIGIALLSLTFTGRAQSSAWYRTQLLQQLGEANHLTFTPSSPEGRAVIGSCKGYPVVAEWQSGIICHLGIELFEPELKTMAGKPLCDFAERYLLEELSCEDPTELERKRIDDGVMQSGSAQSVIGSKELLFSVNQLESGHYELRWESQSGTPLYTLTIPANWGLITGKSKIELENDLKQEIQQHPIEEKLPRVPKPERLEKTSGRGILVYKRGHYMIPEMASALYYRENRKGSETTYTLLSEQEHAAESLINLLSVAALAKEYTAEVSQQKYGFQQEVYRVNLGKLINLFMSNGCEPYVGIEQSDEKQIVATLVMVNKEWGYNHILKVTADRNQIATAGGKLSITINAYTPTHNLARLYDDDNIKKNSKAPKFTIKAKTEK